MKLNNTVLKWWDVKCVETNFQTKEKKTLISASSSFCAIQLRNPHAVSQT